MHDLQTHTTTFTLDAGRPCLDFANTFNPNDPNPETLNTYHDLVAFADQSHLITPDTAAWLHAEGTRDPTTAHGILVRARRVRDSIRAIFIALANDQTPTSHHLNVLNIDLAVSLPHARVVADGDGGFVWSWTGRNLDAPMWPIARSAAELLTSDRERELIRECGAADCSWLFLDLTRNRSRQWCSMTSCGNREKARRHYQRQRTRRASS